MTIEQARQAKARRRAILVALADGDTTVEAALRSTDRYVSCHSVWAILTAAWQVGPVTARKICEDAGVGESIPLNQLLIHEKERLIEELPRRQRAYAK